jgi:cathepsin A (carboxypeptidase C)
MRTFLVSVVFLLPAKLAAETGLNPYDVRRKCDRSTDGDLCYKEMSYIDTWMNDPEVKVALGVDPTRNFASCNMEVNQAFLFQGDGAHNSAKLLTELVNGGVRLLIYAGNAGNSFSLPHLSAFVLKDM